jgi:hypothetical protein
MKYIEVFDKGYSLFSKYILSIFLFFSLWISFFCFFELLQQNTDIELIKEKWYILSNVLFIISYYWLATNFLVFILRTILGFFLKTKHLITLYIKESFKEFLKITLKLILSWFFVSFSWLIAEIFREFFYFIF